MTDNIAQPFDRLRQYLPPHLSKFLTPDIELVEAITISRHIRSMRDVLSTYLPRYLVESIHKDPEPGLVSGGFRKGAVLFADVSGFTPMSEKLSVLGKEGAEEVTGIVNDYFTAMLEINDIYGGDLLKFGGDALLIFFEGNLGSHRALTTGSAMQKAMLRFTQVKTSQGIFPLRMKIGMACGSIFLASLGTPDSMDHAVMGSTLSKMSGAEHHANAGEVVVDDTVREVTRDIASYSPAGDGFWKVDKVIKSLKPSHRYRREFTSSAQDTGYDTSILFLNMVKDADIITGLKPFVPGELFTRIINDPQRITVYGSHRPVTVTFTNFLGIDDIIESLGSHYQDSITKILNTHFVTMSEVVTRFGGTVNRLDAYSVGHRILALFGALQAHEDDPQRAVLAAVEMNKSLQAVNQETRDILASIPEVKDQFSSSPLKQRIGVNSGFVFAGNTGSKIRREYTVMGDQVNLTARLMGIAQEGEVLIGQSTARQTEEAFILLEKETVKVKGKTDPVQNFAVSGIREREHWKTRIASPPIFGRERELELGRDAVEQSINGQACVLLISGASGLGKTRLAEELARYGASKGMDLLLGTCLSYGKTMTYHPWAEVLRMLFGISVTDQTQETSDRLEAVRRGMAAIDEEPWTPVIGTVLGLEIPDNDLTRDLNPKLRRQRVLDLTVKLLETRAHAQPLMLVIEDAHWADPASMDLINYVARNIADLPIMFILPHRPDPGLPDWSGHPHAIDLLLCDLPDEASLDIVQDMIGSVQLPESICQLIINKGSGNPFFLGEVVRALIDAGALLRDTDGTWQVRPDMTTIELPDTIHGIIISRIDRLLATDRRILQVASVVGRVFAYQTLDGVYPYDDVEALLLERLNYLNELGLTESENIELELYRFIHLTTREVVYEGLPFEHRRSLHREIGSYIEEQSAETIGEQTDLLAYHFYEGQYWDKALDYNIIAAQHAQHEYANDTAITTYQRALECAAKISSKRDTRQELLSLHESFGEVLTLVGRYDEALGHYRSARNIVENFPQSPDGLRHQAGLCRKTADVYERRSEYDVAFTWLERGLGHLDLDQPTIEAVRIYILEGGIYNRQGKFDEAIAWCQRTLEDASKIKTREGQQVVAQAYYLLGLIFSRRGDYAKAVQYCKESEQLYQSIEDVVGQARAYNNLAIAYSDLGDWNQASDAYHKSLAINRRIGNIQEQGFVANNLAQIHLDRGEWDLAMELYKQSNNIWKQIDAALFEAITLSNLGQVYIYQENWSEASKCLNRSQDLFTEVGSESFLPELERRWGEFYLRTGSLDQALAHTNRSIEMADELEAILESGMSYRILGEVHSNRGDYEEAKNALHRSLKILRDIDSEYESAKTILSLNILQLDMNLDVDRAQLDQAIQIFEKLGAQADLAEARTLAEQVK